jgi:hypothetical protein
MSFSDPTFVLRYLCQAKSHSSCPPTRIAVQYTTFFRLADMLLKEKNGTYKCTVAIPCDLKIYDDLTEHKALRCVYIQKATLSSIVDSVNSLFIHIYFYPEDGCSMFLLNVSSCLQDYTVLQPKRPQSK